MSNICVFHDLFINLSFFCSVEQKISTQQGSYNITEAQAIMTELRNIQKSLTSGEKEKAELMQSLAKLKDLN